MVFFVRCSVPSVTYLRGEEITNSPVNLDMCSALIKEQHRWYPDNDGLPSIFFAGNERRWVYRDAKIRDEDFDFLIAVGQPPESKA